MIIHPIEHLSLADHAHGLGRDLTGHTSTALAGPSRFSLFVCLAGPDEVQDKTIKGREKLNTLINESMNNKLFPNSKLNT